MHGLAIAAILVGLTGQPASDDDALRLASVAIHLSKSGLRVEAGISNPNDFAVFDVLANCDFKDRRGRILASSTLTTTDAIQANSTRFIRQLAMQPWPGEAKTANCISLALKRLRLTARSRQEGYHPLDCS
jgi:hypothetical protein